MQFTDYDKFLLADNINMFCVFWEFSLVQL